MSLILWPGTAKQAQKPPRSGAGSGHQGGGTTGWEGGDTTRGKGETHHIDLTVSFRMA